MSGEDCHHTCGFSLELNRTIDVDAKVMSSNQTPLKDGDEIVRDCASHLEVYEFVNQPSLMMDVHRILFLLILVQ